MLKLNAEWSEFYLVNAIVALLGISCAMVGWRLSAAALVFPAFMLVNAILFHIVPVVVTRVFSPGLFTAVVLFLPVASWAYWGAWHDGVLTVGTVVISGALGFVLMLFPIVLQKTKGMPIFRQDSEPARGGHRDINAERSSMDQCGHGAASGGGQACRRA